MIVKLPKFGKLGTIADTPTWLANAGSQIDHSRLIDFDLYRVNLPNLPSQRFGIFYTSDHASTGRWGLLTSDSLTGPWTDSGQIYSVTDSSHECAVPIYDPINNRFNIYFHYPTSVVTYGTQAGSLVTTTDFQNFTFVDELGLDGQHTGVRYAEYDGSHFILGHNVLGDESWVQARSRSVNGVDNWERIQTIHTSDHMVGTGFMLQGNYFGFTYKGQPFLSGSYRSRPLRQSATNIPSLIAWPVDPDTYRPIGGYQTLLEFGDDDADDRRQTGEQWIGTVDGKLTIIYCGIDSNSDQHVLVAQEKGGRSVVTNPVITITEDGGISPKRSKAVVFVSWDAVEDDITDSGMEITTTSGTNNSNHVQGSYFEFKGGSGSVQSSRLQTDFTFNPADYSDFRFIIRQIRLKPEVDLDAYFLTLGIRTTSGTLNGIEFHWDKTGSSISTRQTGEFRTINNGSNTDSGGYIWSWCSPEANDVCGDYARNNPIDIELRIHEDGERLTTIINNHIVFTRDISAVNWTDQNRAFFSFFSQSGGHPEFWARFEGIEIFSAVEIDAPPVLRRRMPFLEWNRRDTKRIYSGPVFPHQTFSQGRRGRIFSQSDRGNVFVQG